MKLTCLTKWKRMCLVSNLFTILAESFPDGNFSEQDLWEAIAEVHDKDVNEIMDGDLTEWL